MLNQTFFFRKINTCILTMLKALKEASWFYPATSASDSYTTPSNILLFILLLSSRHSVHTKIGNDNYVVTFASSEVFGLVDIGR